MLVCRAKFTGLKPLNWPPLGLPQCFDTLKSVTLMTPSLRSMMLKGVMSLYS